MVGIPDIYKNYTIVNITQSFEATWESWEPGPMLPGVGAGQVFGREENAMPNVMPNEIPNVMPNAIELSGNPTSYDGIGKLLGIYNFHGTRNGAPSYRFRFQSRGIMGPPGKFVIY